MDGIDTTEALALLATEGPEIYDLLARAGRLRHERAGQAIDTCGIVNARSGNCDQDCAFCSQAKGSRADIDRYPLMSADQMIDAGRKAARQRVHRFSVVTAGKGVHRDEHVDRICRALEEVRASTGISTCASLGHVGQDALTRLREAGVTRYHHNLEAAQSFFPQICTTRRWCESVETVEQAKGAGFEVCVGGIFGMGESIEQRVELLDEIRRLGPDSVPLNFLHPIAGTPLQDLSELTPLDCLKIIAVARLMIPDREIRIGGGREHNLRDLQSWIFLAGADGVLIGHYLTTSGRIVEDDLQMIHDNALSVHPAEAELRR
ncbi:MAG: biotin synthase BioB [bacterium]